MTEARELRALIESLQAENKQLRVEIAAFDELEAEFHELEADYADARRKLERLDEARHVIRRDLAKLKREELEALVTTMRAENETLRTELALANDELDARDRDAARFARELEIALEEQKRLRRVLEQARLDHQNELRKLRKK